jgi:hypothetical protein
MEEGGAWDPGLTRSGGSVGDGSAREAEVGRRTGERAGG